MSTSCALSSKPPPRAQLPRTSPKEFACAPERGGANSRLKTAALKPIWPRNHDVVSPRRALACSEHPCGGFAEKRCFLFLAIALGKNLERIPQHRIADSPLVDGKVAFEHAAPRTEHLNGRLYPTRPFAREFVRRDRRLAVP